MKNKRLNEYRDAAIDAAIWVTASECEWEWTLTQQVAMARYCIVANLEIERLNKLIKRKSTRKNA